MSYLESIANISPAIVTAFALLVVLLEWLILTLSRKEINHKEGIVSLICASLSFFPVFALQKTILLLFMFWVYHLSPFQLGFAWYVWILAWVAYDFMFYAIHWLSHSVRLFWCIHSVHHSPKEMKLSVAFRGSFADLLLSPHTIIWLPLLGFHPFMVLIVETFGRFYGIMVHINERWIPNSKRNWIEKIFVSPSMHRVHHSVNALYLDRNYGEAFSFWDLLFHTYQPEIAHEKPVYGTMKHINSESLLDTQTNEFKALWEDLKKSPSFLIKLKYLINPPGWNHIDGGILANEIRNEAIAKLKI